MDSFAFIYRTYDASAAPKQARRARMDFETVKDMEKLLDLLPKDQKMSPRNNQYSTGSNKQASFFSFEA